MDADTFANGLRTLIIKNDGMVISPFFERWDLKPKKDLSALPKDPIFDLVSNFYCGGLEIGPIRFYDNIREYHDNLAFADFIQDTLIVNLDTVEVQVIDMYTLETKFLCSPNTEAFLNSLLIFAEFFVEEQRGVRFTETHFFRTLDQLVGGSQDNQYAPFWRMIIGLDPLPG